MEIFRQYPKLADAIVASLFALLIFMGKQALENNTRALDDLSESIKVLTREGRTHSEKLAELGVKVTNLDKRVTKLEQ
jgi:hypothetical protein